MNNAHLNFFALLSEFFENDQIFPVVVATLEVEPMATLEAEPE